MTIAIDVREACKTERTGKGQWTFGFVSQLLSRGHPVLLLSDRDIPREWMKFSPRIHRMRPGVLWHVRAASFLRRRRGDTLFLSPTSTIVPSILPSSVACIPVVHDLIAFRREPHDRKARILEWLTLRRALRRALHVCAVSESTKRDLLGRYPFLQEQDVSVIYAGPFEIDPPGNSAEEKTIFCPATLCPRKNQLRLIQAYALLPGALRAQYTLLLTGGRGWHDHAIVDLARRTKGVVWEGYVSPERYITLLSTCTVLALPSLYEGFGMQILDALQRGVPVLTSDRGSLPEVTGACAVLVDPQSVESIADGLRRILTDTELRKNLRASGPKQAASFSWKRSTDLFLDALKRLQ